MLKDGPPVSVAWPAVTSLVGSLLVRVTVRHAAGCGWQADPVPAGTDRFNVVPISRFCPMVPPVSVTVPVPPAELTVIAAVVSGIFAELAWIVAVPGAT